MIKNIILTIFLLAWSIVTFAQETTYDAKSDPIKDRTSGMGSVVIIPFEDRMYMSDADAPIATKTKRV